tara:strand:+ start:1666 stop:2088 length:423 start_codon:yes stop_codon:yes gene_type:complete
MIKHTTKDKKSLRTSDTRLKRSVKGNKNHKISYGGDKRSKSLSTLILDEIFYEKCFNNSNHECEECSKKLPTEFRNDAGKIVSRFRYSHIVAKSIAPELRHDINNINHLCHECHFQWDHGNRKKMDIYKKNQLKFPQFLK